MRFKYDQETRDRMVRKFAERREEAPEESRSASYRRLHDVTGIAVDTMRGLDRARIEACDKAGMTATEREEIKALRKDIAKLNRANEILKTTSAFFAAAELDRRLKRSLRSSRRTSVTAASSRSAVSSATATSRSLRARTTRATPGPPRPARCPTRNCWRTSSTSTGRTTACTESGRSGTPSGGRASRLAGIRSLG